MVAEINFIHLSFFKNITNHKGVIKIGIKPEKTQKYQTDKNTIIFCISTEQKKHVYIPSLFINMVRCSIWYHSYNLENVKNTHEGVLLLVKLQAKAWLSE